MASRESVLKQYSEGVRCSNIARHCGISRERVRQIIKSAGLETPKERKKFCAWCGKALELPTTKVYCSIECKKATRRDYAKQKYREIRKRSVCVTCGCPITNGSTTCRKHKPKDQEAITKVIALFEANIKPMVIAQTLGMPLSTVYKWLRENKNNMKRPYLGKRKITPGIASKIIELHDAGNSGRVIAENFGLTKDVIYKILNGQHYSVAS